MPPFRVFGTIVFRIGGTIELDRSIIVTQPFFTLAGQTAPGDGICIKNASLVIATHDGMPDAWENTHGLDPQHPADGKGNANQEGYTNHEKHLHSLTE